MAIYTVDIFGCRRCRNHLPSVLSSSLWSKTRICRWNFDAICHRSRNISIPVSATTSGCWPLLKLPRDTLFVLAVVENLRFAVVILISVILSTYLQFLRPCIAISCCRSSWKPLSLKSLWSILSSLQWQFCIWGNAFGSVGPDTRRKRPRPRTAKGRAGVDAEGGRPLPSWGFGGYITPGKFLKF